jgi:hypothetical protein
MHTDISTHRETEMKRDEKRQKDTEAEGLRDKNVHQSYKRDTENELTCVIKREKN